MARTDGCAVWLWRSAREHERALELGDANFHCAAVD